MSGCVWASLVIAVIVGATGHPASLARADTLRAGAQPYAGEGSTGILDNTLEVGAFGLGQTIRGKAAGEAAAVFPGSATSARDKGEAVRVIVAAPSTVAGENPLVRQHPETAAPETAQHHAQPAEARGYSPVILIAEQQLDLDQLIARGDQFLALGDTPSARLFYGLAARNGSAKAAAAMGSTYDPVYLQQFDIVGTRPSPEEAIKWYGKAIDMGSSGAKVSLRELTAHLERSAAFGNAEAQRILKELSQ